MSLRLLEVRLLGFAAVLVANGLWGSPVSGQGPEAAPQEAGQANAENGAADDAAAEAEPEEIQAVRVRIASLTAAFNQRDPAAVAAHWTEQGEFITPGDVALKGRTAIQKAYEQYFAANEDVKLDVGQPLLEMHAPSVISERGVAVVSKPDGEPIMTDYVAVHVRTPDGWRIDSVRESDLEIQPSHYEKLRAIEPLIGSWASSEDGSTVTADYRWTKNENFIVNQFKVFVEDVVSLEGTQIIGWDASAGCIRSWTFDSAGGFGVGRWEPEGDGWKVRGLQVLADGSRASSIQLLEPVDENTIRFRSVAREVDGQVLPNIGPIRVSRQ